MSFGEAIPEKSENNVQKLWEDKYLTFLVLEKLQRLYIWEVFSAVKSHFLIIQCTNKAVPEITEDSIRQHCHRGNAACSLQLSLCQSRILHIHAASRKAEQWPGFCGVTFIGAQFPNPAHHWILTARVTKLLAREDVGRGGECRGETRHTTALLPTILAQSTRPRLWNHPQALQQWKKGCHVLDLHCPLKIHDSLHEGSTFLICPQRWWLNWYLLMGKISPKTTEEQLSK